MQKISNHPSIAFLPGWGFDALIWEGIASKITNYSCALQNLPPISNCKKTDSSSIQEVIDNIHNSLPDQCILVAWSLSSLIAALLCFLYPNKYIALVTVAGTAKFVESDMWLGANKDTANQFYENTLNDFPALSKQFIQSTSFPYQDTSIHTQLSMHSLDISHQASLLFYLNMLFQTDALFIYHHLTIPVLQIFGDRDLVLPFAHAKQMIDEYPKHTAHVIKGAGHALFLSHSDEFLKCILTFIESI